MIETGMAAAPAATAYEIVGSVGDVEAIEASRRSASKRCTSNMFQETQLMDQFELRTTVNPAAVSETVRRIVQDVLKAVPVTRVITLADQVDSNIVPNVSSQLCHKFLARWVQHSPESDFRD